MGTRSNRKVIVFIGIMYVMGSHLSFMCVYVCVCAHAFVSVCGVCPSNKKERKYGRDE